MPKYKHLLAPITIGGTVIKNRMMSSFCMPKYLQGPEAYPSEHHNAFYANYARNGAGILIVGASDNYPNQRQGSMTAPHTHMPAFDITNPATLNYFSELTEEVHLYGTKVLLGGGPSFVLRQFQPEDVDPREFMSRATWPEEYLSEEQLEQAVELFIQKVQIFVDCGFDGIADRIDPLLSPWGIDGTQGDEVNEEAGKTVEQRVRFELRCFKRIKEVFGEGFLIDAVMSGQQPYGYRGNSNVGYTTEEFVEFAKLAEGIVDIIEIRNQDIIAVHPTGFTFQKGQHDNIACAKALRASGAKVHSMLIGGFQDPEEMEQLLAEDVCDFIGMARAFMADNDFYQKILEGRGEDIRPCLWCNNCHGPTTDQNGPWVNRCSVNPEMGLEARLDRLVPKRGEKRKVAVIGGGVAGMQAAITAAERGHQVILFEQTDYLGGQVLHAESFSFKWPLRDFKNWQVRQLHKLGVEIRLNTKATPEQIAAEQFDAVIAATGAAPSFPQNIQGLRNEDGSVKPEYRHTHDVFGKEAELGKRVAIVGGSETGVETAMYLAENGHEVTVLTRQDAIGYDCSKSHYITEAWMNPARGNGRASREPAWTKYSNLTGIANATTTRLEGNTVYYMDGQGAEQSITADSIVINGGVTPLQEEALRFYGLADKFYVIGDSNGIGTIQKCVREGWSRANLI